MSSLVLDLTDLSSDLARLPEGCDCARLRLPILDEELPNHVCPEIARDTALNWARETWEEHLPFILDQFGQPWWEWRSWADQPTRATESYTYPVPLADGLIGLAVREWAQEEPNQTLARSLSMDPGWQKALDQFRRYTANQAGADPGEAVESGVLIRGDELLIQDLIVRTLRNHALPTTPATIKYFRAVLEGKSEPLPARGLLVTTLIYMAPIEEAGEITAFQAVPFPNVTIGGDLELTTGPLLDHTQAIALKHRGWVRRVVAGQHPLTQLANIRRAQPGSFGQRPGVATNAEKTDVDAGKDYVTEALRDVDRLRAMASRHPDGREGAITEYLDQIYHRVRKRRTRNHLPATPPPTWRDQARQQLRELLRQ